MIFFAFGEPSASIMRLNRFRIRGEKGEAKAEKLQA
jgi:hypothetical protein